jgi:hypothetical protein
MAVLDNVVGREAAITVLQQKRGLHSSDKERDFEGICSQTSAIWLSSCMPSSPARLSQGHGLWSLSVHRETSGVSSTGQIRLISSFTAHWRCGNGGFARRGRCGCPLPFLPPCRLYFLSLPSSIRAWGMTAHIIRPGLRFQSALHHMTKVCGERGDGLKDQYNRRTR